MPHFQKALERCLKVFDCMQQLQVRENVVGFEKALGAVKVIKDQIQYRSQSLSLLYTLKVLKRNKIPKSGTYIFGMKDKGILWAPSTLTL